MKGNQNAEGENMRILIVEDDAHLAAALARILEDNKYETEVVNDGEAGVERARGGTFDVIIMDVMMPKKDGIEATRGLRRDGVNTPIMLLTARDATDDKVAGYDSGADDYMTKPFAPAELLAHLRALTRRQGDVQFERINAGDLSLDLESYDLSCNGKSIHLSFKEFSIARILMGSPGAVVSKDELISRAWSNESSAGDNNVEAYISFLRKKLAHLGSKAKIETLRKVGYRFVEDPDGEGEVSSTIPLP